METKTHQPAICIKSKQCNNILYWPILFKYYITRVFPNAVDECLTLPTAGKYSMQVFSVLNNSKKCFSQNNNAICIAAMCPTNLHQVLILMTGLLLQSSIKLVS